jgi:hypothetical protein
VAIFALGKTASAGTRKMLVTIAVLTIVLVALTTTLLRERAYGVLVDDIKTSAVPHDPSRMATYTFSLAQFVRERCGDTPTHRLAARSEEEKADDPEGYAEAVSAAEARARTITTRTSCDYVFSEIAAAEQP